MKKILSFDIGGTSIKYGILNEYGEILFKSQMDTEAHLGGTNIIDKIVNKIDEIIKIESIEGIAISTAGIVNTKKGLIAEASDCIKRYKGQEIKKIIQEKFNLKVIVENDVNCAALGEFWKGAGQNSKSIFCITVGTGVGGAIVIDGKILSGNTFSAGEIGYLIVDGDKLDNTGSTRGLVERVKKCKNIKNDDINGKIIFDLAKKNDTISIKEIDKMIDNVSTAIATVSYIINPQTIIIGGAIAEQKEYLLPKFKQSIKEKLIPYIYDSLDIKLATLSNDAGIIGAVYNFINTK